MNEMLINADITGAPAILGNHHRPEFIVVWKDGSDHGIKGARYQASGAKIGDDFTVNAAGDPSPRSPAIAQIGDLTLGGFVVGWISAGNVFLQRFTDQGERSGAVIQVNTTATAPEEKQPAITRLMSGRVVVSWGQGSGIRAQIFRQDGTRAGPEISVNTSDGTHFFPAITQLGGGGFVIAWQANPFAPGGSPRLQMFNPDGTKSRGEQRPTHGVGLGQSTLTFVTSSDVEPADFVNVALSSAGTSGEPDEVKIVVAQLFGPDGALKMSVNLTHRDDLTVSSSPAVVALPAGGLVAAWSETRVPTSGMFDHNIKATLMQVGSNHTEDILVASEGGLKIDTGRPETPKDRDSPCLAAMGENGELIAIAWVEQNLAPPFPRPVIKARILSSQLR
jgi:hypothetical protein